MTGWKKASRQNRLLRALLEGPSGSGKTKGALLLAHGIAERMGSTGGEGIYLLDTENDSAALYANELPFMTCTLKDDFRPENYIGLIQSVPSDCKVLIIDSMSHEWVGPGGCLQIHSAMPGNSFVNWGKVGERHAKFVHAILNAPYHIICTCRSKTTYVQNDEGGKKTVTKAGMEPQQRDGFDYEVDVVLTLQQGNHYAIATKNRTSLWQGEIPFLVTKEEGARLYDWLHDGEIDPHIEFAYEVFAKVGKTRTLEDLQGVWSEYSSRIPACRYAKDINAKFNERKRDIQQDAALGGNI